MRLSCYTYEEFLLQNRFHRIGTKNRKETQSHMLTAADLYGVMQTLTIYST